VGVLFFSFEVVQAAVSARVLKAGGMSRHSAEAMPVGQRGNRVCGICPIIKVKIPEEMNGEAA